MVTRRLATLMGDRVALVGQILVALVTFAGLVYTATQSRQATDKASDVAEKGEKVKGWDALIQRQQGQLESLWPRLDEMDATLTSQRKRISQLEQRLDDYVHRYRVAIRYVGQLREFIAEHVSADAEMPEPPEDLSFDLDDPVESEQERPDGWPPPRR